MRGRNAAGVLSSHRSIWKATGIRPSRQRIGLPDWWDALGQSGPIRQRIPRTKCFACTSSTGSITLAGEAESEGSFGRTRLGTRPRIAHRFVRCFVEAGHAPFELSQAVPECGEFPARKRQRPMPHPYWTRQPTRLLRASFFSGLAEFTLGGGNRPGSWRWRARPGSATGLLRLRAKLSATLNYCW